MVNAWKVILAAIAIVAVLKISAYGVNSNNYYWDEAAYLDIADNIREELRYESSMRENFRAPLLPLLLSMTASKKMSHLLVVMLSLASAFLAYLAGKEILNRTAGLAAALFLAINPLYNFWSYKLLTEPLAICLITLSIYLYIKFEKNPARAHYLYAAFFTAGLATLARYTSISLVAALAVAAISKKGISGRQHLIAWASICAALLPLALLGVYHYQNPAGMMMQNSAETSYPEMPLLSYAQNLLRNSGYFVPIFFIAALFSSARKRVPRIIWAYAIFTMLMLASVAQKYERFLVILLPAYVVISALGFMQMLPDKGKLKAAIIAAVAASSLVVAYSNLQDLDADRHNTEILLDAVNFAKQLGCDTIISNSTKHMGYFAKKQAIGYPATEEEFVKLAKERNISCLSIDSFHGTPGYRKYINDTYKLIYANSSGNKFAYVYST